MILDRPNRILRTGDDRPVDGLYAFVWRMSGARQAIVVMLALAVAALSVAPIDLQRRIIDDAITEGDRDLLVWLAAIYLAVIVVSGAVKFALRMAEGWLSESAIRYCRRHLSGLLDARESEERGPAVSIIRAEIEQVGGFVGNGLSDPAAQIGILCVVLGYMLWVEPFIALCSIPFLLPQLLLAPLVQSRVNRLTETRIDLLRDLSADISGSEDEAAGLDLAAIGRRSNDLFRNRMRIFAWKFAGKALTNFMNALAPIAVLMIGGWMVIEEQTQIGVVVAFTSGFARLSDPLRALIAYYRLAAQTAVKHRKIAEWM